MSDSLPSHGLQCTRLPCPSSIPGACSNIYPSSCWCHPSISSSVIPFFSCLQSFPASEFFQMSQLFSSGGQSIRDSASASVLPMNNQDCFPLGWTGLMSSESKGLSRVFSSTQFEITSSPVLSLLYGPIHSYVTPGKTIALTRQTFVSRLMSLSFNMLSRFV